MALGTALGGWRVIRTLGGRIMKVRPVHGFASQLGGLGVMWGAAFLGGPVSLTQVMSSSIMGSGAAQRLKGVRWQVGQEMLAAWLLTIPVSAIVAAGCYWLIKLYSY
jgi:PiT family inorganic phosphate transporter